MQSNPISFIATLLIKSNVLLGANREISTKRNKNYKKTYFLKAKPKISSDSLKYNHVFAGDPDHESGWHYISIISEDQWS